MRKNQRRNLSVLVLLIVILSFRVTQDYHLIRAWHPQVAFIQLDMNYAEQTQHLQKCWDHLLDSQHHVHPPPSVGNFGEGTRSTGSPCTAEVGCSCPLFEEESSPTLDEEGRILLAECFLPMIMLEQLSHKDLK